MKELNINCDKEVYWLGHNDYIINLTQSDNNIKLQFIGEPPHGDSYHEMYINDKKIDGYVWGCNFAFPFSQKYIVCSWMMKEFDRKTVIINIHSLDYYVLDEYWYNYKILNEKIILSSSQRPDKTILLEEILKKIN